MAPKSELKGLSMCTDASGCKSRSLTSSAYLALVKELDMISVKPWLTNSSRHPNNTSSRLGLAGTSNVPVMRVGNGTWSKPWMRRISSATSAGRVTSLRYAGTVNVHVAPCSSVTAMSSASRMDFNRSSSISVPKKRPSQPKSRSTCASWTVAVPTCSVAATTCAPAQSVKAGRNVPQPSARCWGRRRAQTESSRRCSACGAWRSCARSQG